MTRQAPKQRIDLLTYSGTFVTVRQLSQHWNVSRKQVLRLIQSGRLEAVRLGPKIYRVRVSAVLEFQERSRTDDKKD